MTVLLMIKPASFLFCAVISLSASWSQSVTTAPTADKQLNFDAATIKPTRNPNGGWWMHTTTNGLTAGNVTIRYVIQDAFGVYETERLSHGPAWTETDHWDIQAKITNATREDAENLTTDQCRRMLQQLLADRFQLKVHHVVKELAVLNLVVDKGGLKIHPSEPAPGDKGTEKGMTNLGLPSGPGELKIQLVSMDNFVEFLRDWVGGRILQDKTGLTGHYNIDLTWTPEDTQSSDDSAYPIMAALPRELGLRLVPAKAQIDTIVIDHIEKPSEN